MKLYTSPSQLNQPPHFGRIGEQHIKTLPSSTAEAKRVIAEVQFARIHKTQKHGLRAVVRG